MSEIKTREALQEKANAIPKSKLRKIPKPLWPRYRENLTISLNKVYRTGGFDEYGFLLYGLTSNDYDFLQNSLTEINSIIE